MYQDHARRPQLCQPGGSGFGVHSGGVTLETPVLKAPFPYPGGKSRVAAEVWSRLGNVDNYVEPFMGSLAVLLKRPAVSPVEFFFGGVRLEVSQSLVVGHGTDDDGRPKGVPTLLLRLKGAELPHPGGANG